MINAHTHIFNLQNVPKRFLEGFGAISKPMARMLWPLINTKAGSVTLIWLINTFMKNNPKFSKLGAFLKVGTMKNSNDIFAILKQQYDRSDARFVVLTVNMDHMGADKAMKPFSEQLYELRRIIAQNEGRCLPFYCADPRAHYGNPQELKAAVEDHVTKRQYVGIKIYPAIGFAPFDEHLKPTMEWAAENGVPIMTHCNEGGTFFMGDLDTVRNPVSAYDHSLPPHWLNAGFETAFPLPSDAQEENEKFTDRFTKPLNYVPVLEAFPDLKICFAHAGGAIHITGKRKNEKIPPSENWFDQIKHLMSHYDNVYTDISYALYEKKTHDKLIELLADPKLGGRLLFGTDFFMTLQESSERELVEGFKKSLFKKRPDDAATLWDRLTDSAPKSYLKSSFFSLD